MIKSKYLFVFVGLSVFTSCNYTNCGFDCKLGQVKKLKDDMYDKYFSKIIQSENDLTLIDLRS